MCALSGGKGSSAQGRAPKAHRELQVCTHPRITSRHKLMLLIASYMFRTHLCALHAECCAQPQVSASVAVCTSMLQLPPEDASALSAKPQAAAVYIQHLPL